MINNGTSCCGLDEIQDICDYNDPHDLLMDLCEKVKEECEVCWGDDCTHKRKLEPTAFYLFTDIKQQRYAKPLCEFILKHKLGTISKSVVKVNRNSDNRLRVYVWAVNRAKLQAWYINK